MAGRASSNYRSAWSFLVACLCFGLLFYVADTDLLLRYNGNGVEDPVELVADEEKPMAKVPPVVAEAKVEAKAEAFNTPLFEQTTGTWWTRFDASNDVEDYPHIVYIKSKKVGGSTVGGVVRRIAFHHGLRNAGPDTDRKSTPWIPSGDIPGVWSAHGTYLCWLNLVSFTASYPYDGVRECV